MDPTDPLSALDPTSIDTTSLDSGGAVVGTDGNPSSSLDIGSLMSQLIGTAGASYVASQQASQPNVIIPSSGSSGIVIGGTTIPTTTLFFIGAGVLLFALVLRH